MKKLTKYLRKDTGIVFLFFSFIIKKVVMLFMIISILKQTLKKFSEVIKTLFDDGEIPKERIEYTCIPCISIDSVLRVDKKYYPQVYLEL